VAFFAVAFAGILFLVGHNAPGGGFIAGLLSAAALMPFLLAFGRTSPRFARAAALRRLLPVGLAVALGAGLVPLLYGLPFLRSAHTEVPLPVVGNIGLASSLVFDLGVYLIVLATAVGVLNGLLDRRRAA
jgi:multisubunit Na+/H+ antiporter MnhB subunit